jgi:allantoinase
MPLNAIPPTTTPTNLHIKRQAAQGQCWVDVGFYGGLLPDNAVSYHRFEYRLEYNLH